MNMKTIINYFVYLILFVSGFLMLPKSLAECSSVQIFYVECRLNTSGSDIDVNVCWVPCEDEPMTLFGVNMYNDAIDSIDPIYGGNDCGELGLSIEEPNTEISLVLYDEYGGTDRKYLRCPGKFAFP